MSLEYKIGADVRGFQQGVTQVTQGFNKLDQASNKAFTNIQKNANGGAAALNSLGNVARDLPFGFVAIQNNLPIVFDQLGALTRQSGGVINAFKSIGAALIGPAGVTFAIGAAIAAGTGLIQKYGSLENGINSLFFANDKLVRQQLLLAKIQKESSDNAGQEVARLQVLASVAADTTNSLKNRKEAANELLKTYKEYLPNLTQEALLNNQAADAIDKATKALIAKATAAGAEKVIAENIAKTIELELARNKAIESGKRLQEDLTAELGKQKKITGKPENVTTGQAKVLNGLLTGNQDAVAGIGKELQLLQGDYKFLIDLARQYAKAAGDGFIGDPKDKKVATPKPIKLPFDFAVVKFDENNPALKKAQEEIDKQTIGSTNPALTIPVGISIPQTTLDQLKAFGEAAQFKTVQEQAQNVAGIFNDFLAPAINTAFQALANGQNIGQALAQSFKALLLQLTLTIVKAAALAAILSVITGGAGGVGFAIGGSTFKGFGSIFGGLLGGLPKFAEGGIVTRPTAGIFGEKGAEAIMPLDKLNNLINNTGGSGNVQVAGEFILRNDILYAAVQREGQRQGRVY